MFSYGQIFLRLLLAAVLSGVLGLEREIKHKPAGLRTNMLVGIGSALMMLVSLQFENDPGKIAAGVVAAVGFLGAGLVIKHQDEIRGITTAATIWMVAAIGLAAGLGYYRAAIIATIIAFIVLYFFGSDRVRKIVNLNNEGH